MFPSGSQVERCWNSRIDDCCAGGLADDPCPEIEDTQSSRIEDCEPMRMASLHFRRLHPTREGSSSAGGRPRPSPPRNKVGGWGVKVRPALPRTGKSFHFARTHAHTGYSGRSGAKCPRSVCLSVPLVVCCISVHRHVGFKRFCSFMIAG